MLNSSQDIDALRADVQRLQGVVSTLSQQVSTNEHRLNTHRHITSDLTESVNTTSTPTSYGGYVNSSGTGVVLPTGWTSGLSSHLFTVTHTLGTTNYGVVVTPYSTVAHPIIYSYGTSTFQVELFDSSYSLTDVGFFFTLNVNS